MNKIFDMGTALEAIVRLCQTAQMLETLLQTHGLQIFELRGKWWVHLESEPESWEYHTYESALQRALDELVKRAGNKR